MADTHVDFKIARLAYAGGKTTVLVRFYSGRFVDPGPDFFTGEPRPLEYRRTALIGEETRVLPANRTAAQIETALRARLALRLGGLLRLPEQGGVAP